MSTYKNELDKAANSYLSMGSTMSLVQVRARPKQTKQTKVHNSTTHFAPSTFFQYPLEEV